jgi:hypothetical protein
MKHLVRDWLRDAVPAISVRRPLSRHLDELLADGYQPDARWAQTQEAFKAMVDVIGAERQLMPGAVVPLGDVSEIDLRVPDLSNLDYSAEPPSLFIIERAAGSYLERTEEYKRPLELTEPLTGSGHVYVYYRCFRPAESISPGGEFSRCIYIEYYPADLLIQ